MVDKADLQQVRRFANAAGHGFVRSRWAAIPTRVHDCESVGSSRNYRPKNLPWMTGTFVHRPKADPVPCVGTKAGVHHHDNHALLVRFVVGLGGDDLPPELQQVLGRVGGYGAGILADAGDGDSVGRAWSVSW